MFSSPCANSTPLFSVDSIPYLSVLKVVSVVLVLLVFFSIFTVYTPVYYCYLSPTRLLVLSLYNYITCNALFSSTHSQFTSSHSSCPSRAFTSALLTSTLLCRFAYLSPLYCHEFLLLPNNNHYTQVLSISFVLLSCPILLWLIYLYTILIRADRV